MATAPRWLWTTSSRTTRLPYRPEDQLIDFVCSIEVNPVVVVSRSVALRPGAAALAPGPRPRDRSYDGRPRRQPPSNLESSSAPPPPRPSVRPTTRDPLLVSIRGPPPGGLSDVRRGPPTLSRSLHLVLVRSPPTHRCLGPAVGATSSVVVGLSRLRPRPPVSTVPVVSGGGFPRLSSVRWPLAWHGAPPPRSPHHPSFNSPGRPGSRSRTQNASAGPLRAGRRRLL